MRTAPTLLPLTLALCACGAEAPEQNKSATGQASSTTVQTATLTGLDQGGPGPQRHQMCIVERDGGEAARFGLVVWGRNMHSCSGDGEAVRNGNVLRLTMTGDEQCVIDARIDGTAVKLPDDLPEGCDYYCGSNARLRGATFDKVGGTVEDAARAADLVGDPMCETAR